jgi:hypothetical protein
MRSAIAMVAGAALAAGVAGSSGRPRSYVPLGADFTAGVQVDRPKATVIAPSPGTITAMHWETNTGGVGAGVFTVAAEVNGVTVCSIELDCIASAAKGASCEVDVVPGDDVHVTITESSCVMLPLGVASIWMRFSP